MSRKKRTRTNKTVTSFCICLTRDPEIVDKDSILMVHNRSDAEQLKIRGQHNAVIDLENYSGKPPAVGLPGGGQKDEDMETPKEAAYNEVLEETGFKVSNLKHLFTHYKYIVKDSRTNNRVREFTYYEKGLSPSYKLKANQYIINNHIYVFSGDIDWDGSPLQKILRAKKEEFIDSKDITSEEVERFGMWVHFDELNSEEMTSLNISPQGLEEIDMIGIFPLEYLSRIADQPNFMIFRDGFYPSHVKRIFEGCSEIGITTEYGAS